MLGNTDVPLMPQEPPETATVAAPPDGPVTVSQNPSTNPQPSGIPEYDWTANPFEAVGTPSLKLDSADGVDEAIGLPIAPPQSLGAPAGVYVADRNEASPNLLTAALVWLDSPVGVVQMTAVPAISQEVLEQWLVNCSSCGLMQSVEMPDGGARGILISAPGSNTNVSWTRNGATYSIFGPQETFTPDEAMRLAQEAVAG